MTSPVASAGVGGTGVVATRGAGAGSTAIKKPTPSTARVPSNQTGVGASAPAALATASTSKPASITRRGPSRSATWPRIAPNVMPAN
ncbi:hypothetical protein Taqua_02420 [Tepidimonas aquatica]|uniref:Uncharacterized protein n=1 Tax=Tepidimonas aquatica TaxID=247482 RepID=A0A554W8Z8_9BURK|nr:hypothetical protein Taqua_02420 [Tepidimonas aquatica]